MLNERKLTKTELDKREDIIMSMKKNKRNLVKKYGKDAEAVMYGRATNQAKNKTESMANNKLREMVKDALKNPKAADLNKDGKISDYEKARGSAIEKNIKEAGIEENEDNWADYTDIGQSYLEGFGKEHTLDDNQLEKLGKTIVKRLYKGDIGKAYDAIVKRDLKEVENVGLADLEEMGYNAADDFFETKVKPHLNSPIDFRSYQKGLMQGLSDVANSYGLNEDYKPSHRAYNVIDKASGEIIDNDLPKHMALKLANKKKGWVISPTDSLAEDLDLGHEDNEPHMLKADLYRIGKYAMDLYQMMDELEGQGEVDLPHWWQAKITNAKTGIVGAKHYLDFEIKEPAIDAVVDRMDDIAPEMEIDVVDDIEIEEELFTPNEIGDEAIDRESASGAFESIAEKLAKQLKSKQPIKKVTEGFKVGDKVTMKGGGKEMEITNSRKMIGSKLNAYSVKKSNGKTAEYDESQLKLSKQDKPVKENMVADKDIEKEIKKLEDENPKGFEKEIKKLKVRQAALKLSK